MRASRHAHTSAANASQIGKLEEMWKIKPDAGVDDLDGPNDAEAEVQRVALRWVGRQRGASCCCNRVGLTARLAAVHCTAGSSPWERPLQGCWDAVSCLLLISASARLQHCQAPGLASCVSHAPALDASRAPGPTGLQAAEVHCHRPAALPQPCHRPAALPQPLPLPAALPPGTRTWRSTRPCSSPSSGWRRTTTAP
jgi:hypothetical protein